MRAGLALREAGWPGCQEDVVELKKSPMKNISL